MQKEGQNQNGLKAKLFGDNAAKEDDDAESQKAGTQNVAEFLAANIKVIPPNATHRSARGKSDSAGDKR
jgi:hypothetical protein